MGFLKKLFGGSDKSEKYVDKDGIYFHSRCQNCGSVVRNRIDKQHDLSQSGGGYVWHKTIIDSRCFRPMPTVVHFDSNYNIVSVDMQGGEHISELVYQQALEVEAAAKAAAAAEREAAADDAPGAGEDTGDGPATGSERDEADATP